jgi:glycogen(starch) synthase
MRLLLYSHFFAPSVGGVETFVFGLAKGLTRWSREKPLQPIDVTVVTHTPAGDFDDNTVPFRVVREPKLIELYGLFRHSDVVHVAGPALAPLLVGLLAQKPMVVEHHGFQTICPNGQLVIEPSGAVCPGHFMGSHHMQCLRCHTNRHSFAQYKLWVLTFVRRFLCKFVSANVSPTRWLADLLKLPRTVVVPHGIDVENVRASMPESRCEGVIGFQGRLVSTKGALVLIEAARNLRNRKIPFNLVIIGDGPERPALEAVTLEYGLTDSVQFTGRLSAVQVDATLAKASVVVVPSIGGEVFGLVVAENMARGLPVLASDLGSFIEVLGPAGITFRVGNATELAERLIEILNDGVRRQELGLAARRRIAAAFSETQMLEEHFRIYDRLFTSLNNKPEH